MKQDTIHRIVKATGITPGELVLIHFWGDDYDKAIANQFLTAVAAQGASPVLLQQCRSINRDIFSAVQEGAFEQRYFELFSKFDTVLDVFAYQPIVLGYSLEAQQMQRYRNYIATLFYKLMEAKRFVQIRIPTTANAAESGLEPEDYICRMNRAYDIDYDALAARCREEIMQLQMYDTMTLCTGDDHQLHFRLRGRSWHIDAGDGDLPCGEVYIAPEEELTHGSVFFKQFWLEDRRYENVALYVSNGMVVGANDAQVAAYFEEQKPENRVVCELGFGMNPNVTDLCGYRLLDEKMANTFHIAVGANQMFGGSNQASDHIDFVGTEFTLKKE